MADIIKAKNGKLHIYVRQDTYKGKLRSENWVGRTFFRGKQRVLSSGSKDLEEATKILEKWYDNLQNTPEAPEEDQNSNNPQSSNENDAVSGTNNLENLEIKESSEKPPLNQPSKTSILEKLKNTKLDFSFLKKINFKNKYDVIINAVNHDNFKDYNYNKIKKLLSKNGIVYDLKDKFPRYLIDGGI